MASSESGVSKVLLTGMIIGMLIGATLVLAYHQSTPTRSVISQISPSPTVFSSSPSPSSGTVHIDNSITSLDTTWNLYTNKAVGYSLKVPQQASFPGCDWDGSRNSFYFSGKTYDLEPVTIFQDNSTVYLDHASFNQLGGRTDKSDGSSTFATCTKTANSLELIKQNHPSGAIPWAIKTATIHNDDELNKFINSNFGTGGCQLNSKTEAQPGTFDVHIKTDNKPADQSKCFINYVLSLKYSPAKQLLAYWDQGQNVIFYQSGPPFVAFDSEMAKSFQFK